MDPVVLGLIFLGSLCVLFGVRGMSRGRGTLAPGSDWSPAKQIIFEAKQERNHRVGTYSMTAGLIILWGNVIFLAVPIFDGTLREERQAAHTRASVEPRTSMRIAGCTEKCGDGVCTAFSCIQEGCTCAESYKTCAKDCPAPPDL